MKWLNTSKLITLLFFTPTNKESSSKSLISRQQESNQSNVCVNITQIDKIDTLDISTSWEILVMSWKSKWRIDLVNRRLTFKHLSVFSPTSKIEKKLQSYNHKTWLQHINLFLISNDLSVRISIWWLLKRNLSGT
jgi:hypothetical protein